MIDLSVLCHEHWDEHINFDIESEAVERALGRFARGETDIYRTTGIPALKAAICRYLAPYGIVAKPSEIAVISRRLQAYRLVAEVLLGHGAEMWFPELSLVRHYGIAERHTTRRRLLELDADGQIDFEAMYFSKRRKVVFLEPSRQKPTGASIPEVERRELVEVARGNNTFIFEDAYRKTREDGYADAVKQIWEALRRDSEINTVILRGYWGSYLRETFVSEKNNNWTVEEKFINHWRHVFSELERLNKKVILILDNPPYPNGSLSRCVPLQRIRLLPVVNECTFDYTSIDEEHVKAKAILEKEAKSWSNVTIIDLEKIFCKNGKCMVTSGDQIYYRDEDHLSTDGNKLVWDFILSKLSH